MAWIREVKKERYRTCIDGDTAPILRCTLTLATRLGTRPFPAGVGLRGLICLGKVLREIAR